MKKLKAVSSVILFLLIFTLLLDACNELFRRKTLNGAWNHTTKIAGFYNEPKDSFDMMFFGSSNTYCSFHPLVLWEEKNIRSYVFATQQQPVWATYAYMKEALKTQKPDVMVLDVLMFSKHEEYYDDGVNYSFADDLPLSWNKVELARVSAPGKDWVGLIFPFIKYHSRWNELNEQDYAYEADKQRDYLKGYVLLEQTTNEAVRPDVSDITEAAELSEKELSYFHKIRTLCEEEGVKLLLVKTPCNPDADLQKHLNSVAKLAEEHGLQYIDFNHYYNEIGLDLNTDFYDKTHLNYKGAEKFTRYFATLFDKQESPQNTADWNKDLQQYHSYLATIS